MKDLREKIDKHPESSLYVDPLRKTYDRGFLCCILWVTQPEYCVELVKTIDSVRGQRKDKVEIVDEIVTDFLDILEDKQGKDYNSNKRFGKQSLIKAEVKKKIRSAKSADNIEVIENIVKEVKTD